MNTVGFGVMMAARYDGLSASSPPPGSEKNFLPMPNGSSITHTSWKTRYEWCGMTYRAVITGSCPN